MVTCLSACSNTISFVSIPFNLTLTGPGKADARLHRFTVLPALASLRFWKARASTWRAPWPGSKSLHLLSHRDRSAAFTAAMGYLDHREIHPHGNEDVSITTTLFELAQGTSQDSGKEFTGKKRTSHWMVLEASRAYSHTASAPVASISMLKVENGKGKDTLEAFRPDDPRAFISWRGDI
ncbi:hypothetical protein BJV77DRAFT_630889 [Russula vinacea]|nr:hypothetical protein BJV77DRAFT_630889 [Russula vinacea]